jgi:voltage-gated potassium channel
MPQRPDQGRLRQLLYDVIFESDTKPGKLFDVSLLILILASIATVSLESVQSISTVPRSAMTLAALEGFFTVCFALEYLLRCFCVKKTSRYVFSFWGIVDLLSFLPTALAGLGGGAFVSFVILRSIRLLRVFRILKLWRMMSEAQVLSDAVWQARDKIIVFLIVVLIAVTISGTLMYHAEQNEPNTDFTSIPQSMYWAVVTMTTVGYGDIAPQTTIGKLIAATLILLGYSLIIVPSGFVSAEISKQVIESVGPSSTTAATAPDSPTVSEQLCSRCKLNRHLQDANYCARCGTELSKE